MHFSAFRFQFLRMLYLQYDITKRSNGLYCSRLTVPIVWGGSNYRYPGFERAIYQVRMVEDYYLPVPNFGERHEGSHLFLAKGQFGLLKEAKVPLAFWNLIGPFPNSGLGCNFAFQRKTFQRGLVRSFHKGESLGQTTRRFFPLGTFTA